MTRATVLFLCMGNPARRNIGRRQGEEYLGRGAHRPPVAYPNELAERMDEFVTET